MISHLNLIVNLQDSKLSIKIKVNDESVSLNSVFGTDSLTVAT